MKQKKGQRRLLMVLRLLFGCIFLFSGYVKAIDPLGTNYKILDYLEALHLTGLDHLALAASVILCAFELTLGVALVLGIRFKTTLWGALLFMGVMTPITLWIALYNPVTDCGCFGDALVIGNWTTFWKNIVLDLLWVALYLLRHQHRPYLNAKASYGLWGLIFAISCGLSFYSMAHLPSIDFRPYHVGANIIEGMQLKPGQHPDKYKVTFVYRKDGKEQTFDMSEAPYKDKSWEFVRQNSKLIKKGDVPAMHDFLIYNIMGEDITDSILQTSVPQVIVVMYDLKKTKLKYAEEINALYQEAQDLGYGFFGLTSSVDLIPGFRQETGASYPIYNMDVITLKTVVRANPGIVVLKDATIQAKWNMSDNSKHDLKIINFKY